MRGRGTNASMLCSNNPTLRYLPHELVSLQKREFQMGGHSALTAAVLYLDFEIMWSEKELHLNLENFVEIKFIFIL